MSERILSRIAVLGLLASLHCAGQSPAPPAETLNDVVNALAERMAERVPGRVGILPFIEREHNERTLAGDYVSDAFYPVMRNKVGVLVERSFAQKALSEELCRSKSLKFDESAALEIGRLLSAQFVLTGILTDLRRQGTRLDVRLLDVNSGTVLGSEFDLLPPGAVPSYLMGKASPESTHECRGNKPVLVATRATPPATLNVGIRKWGGYAGGLYYNGGLLPSVTSRFGELGVKVRFKVLENLDDSIDAWRRGQVDAMWITIDDLPTEYARIRAERPRVVLQTGWSRGEEVVVARDDVVTLNDLRGRTIALEPHTTAHSFLLVSLDLAGLDYSDVDIIPARSNREAADLFIRGQADAAVVWIDEDERCLRQVPGAHRLESTKDASYLIAESLMVKAEVLSEKRVAVERLAQGWLQANAEINRSPRARRKAINLMVREFDVSRHLAEEELDMVRLATLGDNLNFFGLDPRYRGEKGEDLYQYFWERYRAIERIGRKPRWRRIADTSIVAGLEDLLRGVEHGPEPEPDFSHCLRRDEERLAIKGLSVNFGTDEHHLTPDDKRTIDRQFVRLAEIFYNDCIRVDGNTDNVGRPSYNDQLSLRRARAVADYLMERYGFHQDRIITVGNGSRHPVASNDTLEGRERNRRTDFELLRRRE